MSEFVNVSGWKGIAGDDGTLRTARFVPVYNPEANQLTAKQVKDEMVTNSHEYLMEYKAGMSVEALWGDGNGGEAWWPCKIASILSTHQINLEGAVH